MHRRDFITSSTLATLALALPAFADTVPPKPMRLLIPGDKTESRSGKVGAVAVRRGVPGRFPV